ncbi:hypothetical protein BUY79_12865 [Staphylococcus equorum]|nr:hypothetical protein BUY77_12770 [Staphylococcus equorum]PTE82357.1 hypothetical protein BUY79_12865 [Staphylococcus equorum]PTF11185.1 hypothetical protein BUY81_07525 [Staphylococcus equorum]RIL45899.1 hypothetical protein BUY82_12840 [Staphylococcus equorum]
MNESVKYNRISELDYMRGTALLGIILTNIISIFVLSAPSNYDQVSYLKLIGNEHFAKKLRHVICPSLYYLL